MTEHVHTYCNRCGRELDPKSERGVRLVRTVIAARSSTGAIARSVPEASDIIDLCDRCDGGFHRWLGDREALT